MQPLKRFASMTLVAALMVAPLSYADDTAPAMSPFDGDDNEALVGLTTFSGELAFQGDVNSVICDDEETGVITVAAQPLYLAETLAALEAEPVGEGTYALPDGRVFAPLLAGYTWEGTTDRSGEGVDGERLPEISINEVSVVALPEYCLAKVIGWICFTGSCNNNCDGFTLWYNNANPVKYCKWTGNINDSCDKKTKVVRCKWKTFSQNNCQGTEMSSGDWKSTTCK